MRCPAFRLPAVLVLAAVLAAGEVRVATALPPPPAPASGRHAEVTVEPTATSIYIGKVSLAMPPFTRRDGIFTTAYTAKVFPFFFYSERGNISIEFSDEQLQKLEHGETVYFKGHASSTDGDDRRIEGRAVPDAAGGGPGKIKVRVWVSKRIELIFNSVYRFTGKE